MVQLFILEDMAWRCSIISSYLFFDQFEAWAALNSSTSSNWSTQRWQSLVSRTMPPVFSGSGFSFWDVMRCVSSDDINWYKICAMICHDMPWYAMICNAACLCHGFRCEFHVPQRFLLSPKRRAAMCLRGHFNRRCQVRFGCTLRRRNGEGCQGWTSETNQGHGLHETLAEDHCGDLSFCPGGVRTARHRSFFVSVVQSQSLHFHADFWQRCGPTQRKLCQSGFGQGVSRDCERENEWGMWWWVLSSSNLSLLLSAADGWDLWEDGGEKHHCESDARVLVEIRIRLCHSRLGIVQRPPWLLPHARDEGISDLATWFRFHILPAFGSDHRIFLELGSVESLCCRSHFWRLCLLLRLAGVAGHPGHPNSLPAVLTEHQEIATAQPIHPSRRSFIFSILRCSLCFGQRISSHRWGKLCDCHSPWLSSNGDPEKPAFFVADPLVMSAARGHDLHLLGAPVVQHSHRHWTSSCSSPAVCQHGTAATAHGDHDDVGTLCFSLLLVPQSAEFISLWFAGRSAPGLRNLGEETSILHAVWTIRISRHSGGGLGLGHLRFRLWTAGWRGPNLIITCSVGVWSRGGILCPWPASTCLGGGIAAHLSGCLDEGAEGVPSLHVHQHGPEPSRVQLGCRVQIGRGISARRSGLKIERWAQLADVARPTGGTAGNSILQRLGVKLFDEWCNVINANACFWIFLFFFYLIKINKAQAV